jgi:hypothetical protein
MTENFHERLAEALINVANARRIKTNWYSPNFANWATGGTLEEKVNPLMVDMVEVDGVWKEAKEDWRKTKFDKWIK